MNRIGDHSTVLYVDAIMCGCLASIRDDGGERRSTGRNEIGERWEGHLETAQILNSTPKDI